MVHRQVETDQGGVGGGGAVGSRIRREHSRTHFSVLGIPFYLPPPRTPPHHLLLPATRLHFSKQMLNKEREIRH